MKIIKKRIIYISLASLLLLFVVFLILTPYIFGKDSATARITEEFFEDLSISQFFESRLGNIIQTITSIVIMVGVFHALKLLMKLLSLGSSKGKTILELVTSLVKYACIVVLVGMILSAWGVDTAALLAGMGVVGLVVGLGAQSLISDMLSGIFIVIENEFKIGDIITIEGFRGEVEEIALRTTKIRSATGDVKIVNNSCIKSLINMSMHRSLAYIDIMIGLDEDLEAVEEIIKNELDAIADKFPVITEGPWYKGVSEITPNGMFLKVAAKCDESERLQFIRDLNREIKLLFDRNNIKLPHHQVEIHEEPLQNGYERKETSKPATKKPQK
ncbi:MAG: mechanosensitive ion channel family protein [Firmicutes bacterium]|nr:mechanosensitive ion channel family protein [Bacillota bacterium]